MNNLFQWLKRPYPNSASWKSKLVTGVAISTFIFLFLRLFQPFGLHNEFPYKNLIIGGFGLVTFIAYGIEVFLFPLVFPQFYSEEKWTTGKQLLMSISTVLMIALGNWLYMAGIGFTSFSPYSAFLFFLNTFLVGAFPLTISVIITEMRLLKLHSQASEAVNNQLRQPLPPKEETNLIQINNEEGKTVLQLSPSDLIYIASADNYVEVHYLEQDQSRKQLIRSSLRRVESQLADQPQMLRCHRSYLVNLDLLQNSEGNSAGLRLDLKGTSRTIPVSRSYVPRVREAIDAR